MVNKNWLPKLPTMKIKVTYLDVVNYFKQLFGIRTAISKEFCNCYIMKDLKYLAALGLRKRDCLKQHDKKHNVYIMQGMINTPEPLSFAFSKLEYGW